MGDSVCDDAGFSAAGAGQEQHRFIDGLDGPELFGIEVGEIELFHGGHADAEG